MNNTMTIIAMLVIVAATLLSTSSNAMAADHAGCDALRAKQPVAQTITAKTK